MDPLSIAKLLLSLKNWDKKLGLILILVGLIGLAVGNDIRNKMKNSDLLDAQIISSHYGCKNKYSSGSTVSGGEVLNCGLQGKSARMYRVIEFSFIDKSGVSHTNNARLLDDIPFVEPKQLKALVDKSNTEFVMPVSSFGLFLSQISGMVICFIAGFAGIGILVTGNREY